MKVRCNAKDCGSIFNIDYRLQHNRKQHGGKSMPFQTVGAPRSPFEAAKHRTVCMGQSKTGLRDNVNENVSTTTATDRQQMETHLDQPDKPVHEFETGLESSSIEDLSSFDPLPSREEPDLFGEIDRPIEVAKADDAETTSSSYWEREAFIDSSPVIITDIVDQTSNVDITLPSQASEIDNDFVSDNSSGSTESSDAEEELDTLWVTCAGKLQHIMNNLDRTGHLILEEMKHPSVPNIEQFVVSVSELAESMVKQSIKLKNCAKRSLEKIKKGKRKVWRNSV